jgi:hypothetical protein
MYPFLLSADTYGVYLTFSCIYTGFMWFSFAFPYNPILLSGDILQLEPLYAQYECKTIMLAVIVEAIKTNNLPFVDSFIF